MPTFNAPSDNQAVRDDLTAIGGSVVPLGNITGATTVTIADDNNIYTATMTGNCTFTFTPGTFGSTSFAAGDSFYLLLTQDATGSRTATWPANFKKAGGTLTLTTTANAVDLIRIAYDGTNFREVARSLAQA